MVEETQENEAEKNNSSERGSWSRAWDGVKEWVREQLKEDMRGDPFYDFIERAVMERQAWESGINPDFSNQFDGPQDNGAYGQGEFLFRLFQKVVNRKYG